MIKDIKFTNDLEAICSDIKVCGRKEFSDLLKLKYNYGVKIGRAAKDEKALRQAEEGIKELTQEEIEAQVDKELEDTLKRVDREKKRQLKKERVRE